MPLDFCWTECTNRTPRRVCVVDVEYQEVSHILSVFMLPCNDHSLFCRARSWWNEVFLEWLTINEPINKFTFRITRCNALLSISYEENQRPLLYIYTYIYNK